MIAALIFLAMPVFSAETKVEGRIYSSWMLNASKGAESYNTFDLGRSYITVKSKLSDYTSVNITTDLRRVDAYDGYTIVLKYGYASWKPKFGKDYLTVVFGLQPTKYIEAVDGNFWGRRYIAQSIGDVRSFLTTSDLGLTFNMNLDKQGNYGSAGLAILNGTKYSDVDENNKQKDFNPYFVVKPLPDDADFGQSQIAGQFYYGTRNVFIDTSMNAGDYRRMLLSLGGKLAYKSMIDFGFDFNLNSLAKQGLEGADLNQLGLSFFGSLYFKDMAPDIMALRTLDFFGRLDIYDPNTDGEKDGETQFLAGVECVPIKGIAASLNFRITTYERENSESSKYLYLNSEFRF